VLKVRIFKKYKKIVFFSSILACSKFQCLSVIKNNKTICECANRRVPCDKNLDFGTKDNCENPTGLLTERSPTFLKSSDGKDKSICEFLMILLFFS